MNNEEIEIAWRYHNGTKHPNGVFLTMPHFYDSTLRPNPYKIYNKLPLEIPLPPVDESPSMPTLKSISRIIEKNESNTLPNLQSLTRILHFSGGITKTINFAGLGAFEFRAASCTGALYHIEIYIVCGDIEGLEAGVYHFDPKEMKLGQLRKGDFREVLTKATAGNSNIKHAPITLIYTDIHTRNSIKYRTREYRHAFWDCGTIIANTLAMCQSNGLESKVILGFVDETISHLIDLDQEKEVAVALIPIGQSDAVSGERSINVKTINLTTEPLSNYDHDDIEIRKIHQASSFTSPQQVREWKLKNSSISLIQPSTNHVFLKQKSYEFLTDETIETTIKKRGSTRKFSRDPISFEQISTVIHYSTQGISTDYISEFGDSIIDLYLIVNSVDGLKPGSYYFNRKRNSLQKLREEELREEAMHLGLDQALPLDGSVCVFFMTNLEKILANLGNRGYRAAQMEASIIGGRFYLASYSQGLGATGLTFYDDAVTKFFSPYSDNENTMFMMVLGKKWSNSK